MSLWSAVPSIFRACRPPSPPRHELAARTFHTLDKHEKLEEETLPSYRAERYYPAYLGEVLDTRYQILCKLGYGVYSTVWLCRDLRQHSYVALKIFVSSTSYETQAQREIQVSQHLNHVKTQHAGRAFVRTIRDQFVVTGPNGQHHCFVHTPLSVKLSYLHALMPRERFPSKVLRSFVWHMLTALDFLHSDAGVIHGDIQSANILLENKDEDALAEMARMEIEDPSDRKIIDDQRVIYRSRAMPKSRIKSWGRPILCDFGEARFARRENTDDIQPEQYRAPEVILGHPWNEKVDIWNLGCMVWHLFEDKDLFETHDSEGPLSNLVHLAHITAYLGPPPRHFVGKGGRCARYFEDDGTFKGTLPTLSFEDAEENLDGDDKTLFLDFIRSMLRWLPEERKSAKELLADPWLNSK